MDPRFVLDDFEPAYLKLHEEGTLATRAETALAGLESCTACPRACGVNRLEGETGVCRTGRHPLVSSAFPHLGEERCLRGRNGSGTIFFSLCNLQCVFCQNWDISQQETGRACTAEEIAGLMLQLQSAGCHNINLVTPEHVVPQVIEAIAAAVPAGLGIPVVYNTSAFDTVASLKMLEGLVDIYMPDFKYWNPGTAHRLSGARDYPERAREALLEMHRQVGPLRCGTDGIARRGVLVRHLVMPGQADESEAIFRWLADDVSPDTFVNIMAQYRPANKVGGRGKEARFEEINRRPSRRELENAYQAAREAGLWRFDIPHLTTDF